MFSGKIPEEKKPSRKIVKNEDDAVAPAIACAVA